MLEKQEFWVLGGDLRQEKLAQLLYADGRAVHAYALEEAELPLGIHREETLEGVRPEHCVILPLPMSREEGELNAPMSGRRHLLEDVLAALPAGTQICGGMVSEAVAELAARYGHTIVDYFRREELTVANAVPTAEGAVQIALEELGTTLHGTETLVLGYGRVGKLTAHRLGALSARVTVCARKYADLAWAAAYGHTPLDLRELDSRLGGFALVVNTVPHLLLTRERLARLSPGTLVIDLASKPGGVDFSAAAQLGVQAIWALSLPGKVAPVTAGAALRDTIYHILQECS